MKISIIFIGLFCGVLSLKGTTLTITNQTPFVLSCQCVDWTNKHQYLLKDGEQKTMHSLSAISCNIAAVAEKTTKNYQKVDPNRVAIQQCVHSEPASDAVCKFRTGNGAFGAPTGKHVQATVVLK